MKNIYYWPVVILSLLISSCGKKNNPPPTNPPASFSMNTLKVNGIYNGYTYRGLNTKPVVKISFSSALDPNSVSGSVAFTSKTGAAVTYSATYENNDSTMVITPSATLQNLSQYTLAVSTGLQSSKKGSLGSAISVQLNTAIDSTDKFPQISDDALLTLIQQQTFKYFWDFGHPVSGLARERNTSGDVVTMGGSGFGIMSIVVGTNRGFITRAQGLARMQTIVGFLLNNAQKFHGAFPHWMNGVSGAVVPFSTQDDGADLVETAYLMEGLLTARQYFNDPGTAETTLRNNINTLWNGVEWDWFRQNGQNTLYWHWSPDYGWSTGQQIAGWNEALITYVLAASSNTHSVPKAVYDNGWAQNGQMKNGSSYYGITLPLGPVEGGPLFFAHYSFMGINPNGLSDAYASYDVQNKAHAMINYDYCTANPQNYYGYSNECWGLTASDVPNGYNANSPTSDLGVIAPTAAIASLPYTPAQSMAALHFFYYKLGDKLWGQYGFYDAFDLDNPWFASSDLAIDEGPIICMIENYRSGLLWNLFMSCPEVKTGMKNLSFQSPNL
ncbi:MAG TPA: glucoamylase family protein [Mucilaginibacter sp.]|jgi:hypothetical protein|nr:glucoamylase family protein [Mucilaginibacter sp.]